MSRSTILASTIPLEPNPPASEADEICLHSVVVAKQSVIPFDRYSNYTHMVRVIAWVIRFAHNCIAHTKGDCQPGSGHLSVVELGKSETHLLNTTPTSWPLARVIKVHPGSDGTVRVVTLKTSTGCYTHPVTKLAPLFCDT